MKKKLCAIVAISLMMVMFVAIAYAVVPCEHAHEYYSGFRYKFRQDEVGHHKETYDIYYCPECESEDWILVEVTFVGHEWTYIDQEHRVDMELHIVYYECLPCGKTHQVWYECKQYPCAIRYYSIRPEMVMY